MDATFVAIAVRMSAFKKSPAGVLRAASGRPVAVLARRRVALYAMEPHLFEILLESIADQELYRNVVSRLAEGVRAVEVDIDAL